MERNYTKDCANFTQVLQVGESPSHLLLDIDWQKGWWELSQVPRTSWELGNLAIGNWPRKCARKPTFSEVMIPIDISKKNVDIVHFDQVGFGYFGSLCKM